MLQFSIFTDKGGREINEDTIKVSEKEDRYCFVLCDGLGGHGMGDAASLLVAEVIIEEFEKSESNEGLLETVFMKAQSALLKEQDRRQSKCKMKTTAAVLLLDSKYARIGHVGDSRVYVFKRNKIWKRTLDHSVPQMLATSHQIKESEIRRHPDRNTLMKVMGIEWEKPMFELQKPIKLKKCDEFLICSDGFWECVEEAKMEQTVTETDSSDAWMKKMVEEACSEQFKKKSEMDNYSAIAVITK